MQKKAKENDEIKNAKNISTSIKTKKVTNTKTTKTKSPKKTTTRKKSETTVSPKKSTSKKKTTTSAEKKTSTKKSKTTKTSSTNKKTKNTITEYYDLPEKYNKTVVKILAQTPKTLFIYWEISNDDIEKYKNQYGENFFEKTRPVLIIHNTTLNYSFEVEINDFANSWYLHINDSKSDYKIELGRRPVKKDEKINTDYIYISSSNKIETPNDHILFNTSNKMVNFRNIKTNQETKKSFKTLSFMKNLEKIYNIHNIYNLYKKLYTNEDSLENLSNPSSHTSSQFK